MSGPWPYADEVVPAQPGTPSWSCPEDKCVCHPDKDGTLHELSIMLCSEDGSKMAGARCRVLVNGREANADSPYADGSGWVTVVVSRPPASVLVEWAPADTPNDPKYPYRVRYHADLALEDRTEAGRRRLANLGFSSGATLEDNVAAFQRHYGYTRVTGVLHDVEDALVEYHDQARVPVVPARGLGEAGSPAGTEAEPQPTAPSSPPPGSPPSKGHEKAGGGEPPGQGTVRAEHVVRELRLLDFDFRPAADAACEIEVDGLLTKGRTDGRGVVVVRSSRRAERCRVQWSVQSPERELAVLERDDVSLSAIDEPSTAEGDGDGLLKRLGNLGHLQKTREERVLSYQLEMGRQQTGRAEDVAEEVRDWHDGGQTPAFGGKSASSAPARSNLLGFQPDGGTGSSGGSPSVSTVAPLPLVKIYNVTGDDPGPNVGLRKMKGGSIWQLDLVRGQHTGVTIVDSKGLPIESNNPDNAVPNDRNLWVDENPSDKERHLFFMGKRMPKTDQSNNQHVALLLIGPQPPPSRRTVLQVRVSDVTSRRGIVLMKLYGRAMVLNNADITQQYTMDKTVVIRGEKFKDMVTMILKEIADKGPLVHLIINAHGKMFGQDAVIHCGSGISKADHDEWKRLKGKLKYIWLQDCSVASDQTFAATIAHNTGAWVTAYFGDTSQENVPAHHLDYPYRQARNWFGPDCDPAAGKLIPSTFQFFDSARHSRTGSLSKALHFNIIKILG